mmetsp:Transcript_35597/g.57143  ORF Transcript_35597/g.57143 Transcript_35597/m.57143 type:complete len:88 (-) Transcript_35597:196-459(-)
MDNIRMIRSLFLYDASPTKSSNVFMALDTDFSVYSHRSTVKNTKINNAENEKHKISESKQPIMMPMQPAVITRALPQIANSANIPTM